MAAYPSVIALGLLDGNNGFAIPGLAAFDHDGYSVSGAGDVNGDGYADLVIGALGISSTQGQGYVVFGAKHFGATFDLSTLDGAKGFHLDNSSAPANAQTGSSVSAAGDVNGDGLADFIIGAPHDDTGGTTLIGVSYVVYGTTLGFPASLDLHAIDGNNGFKIPGLASPDNSGVSVSGAGDVNGDGVADLIVGAWGAGSGAGESYVVFGHVGGFGASFDLSTLDGANGFRIDGQVGDASGLAVSSAGDVNGDGYADVVVGAEFASHGGFFNGSAYVVFGAADGYSGDFALADIDGNNGFRLDGGTDGAFMGVSVSSAGDINGDGRDDLIVGANGAAGGAGSSYIIFGTTAAFATTFDLSTLDGHNGFRIDGGSAGDNSGWSVSDAGDVNADGFADLIVGAYQAGGGAGAAYVLFGAASGFGASVSLGALDGNNGYRLDGVASSNAGYSVSGAGDVNHDGIDDLIVGGYRANGDAGESFVVFGSLPGAAVTRIGSAIGQTIRGGAFNDVLSGLGGDDSLFGNDGKDHLDGGKANDTLSGAGGNDVLTGGANTDKLTGGSGADTFVYTAVSDSADKKYDTIADFTSGQDHLDLWFAVAGIDATVSAAKFSQLASALDAAHLGVGDAALATIGARTFIVVDANGVAGYQAGEDLVIRADGVAALSGGDFI